MPYTGPYRDEPLRTKHNRWGHYRRVIAANSVQRIWPPSSGRRLWVTIVNERFLKARSES